MSYNLTKQPIELTDNQKFNKLALRPREKKFEVQGLHSIPRKKWECLSLFIACDITVMI